MKKLLFTPIYEANLKQQLFWIFKEEAKEGDVQIFQAEPGPLSADSSYTFHCHPHGARPPAALSWFDSHGNRLIAASSEVN